MVKIFLFLISFILKNRQVGNFTPSVNGTNLVSTFVKNMDKEIIVQHGFTEISVSISQFVEVNPNGEITTTIGYPDSASYDPSNPFCSLIYPGSIEETFWAASLTRLTDFVIKTSVSDTSDMVGTHLIKASCFNLVSRVNGNATTTIQRRLTGIKVENMNNFGGVNKEMQFKVSFTKCSHAVLHVDFNDTTSDTIVHPKSLNCSEEFIFKHTYTNQGNYTIVVTASNNLSHVEVGKPTAPLIIQFAIEDLIVTNNCPIGFPPGDAEFTVELNKSLPLPTGVFLTWDFNDGNTVKKYFSEELSSGSSHKRKHQYASPLGAANVTITASNLVSTQEVISKCSVVRTLENLEFSASKQFVQTQGAVDFDVSVTQGTDVSYTIKFGDGKEDNKKVFGDSTGEKIKFTHQYDTPNNYTINVKVKNDVGEISSESPTWLKSPVVVYVQREVVKDAIKVTFPGKVAYPRDRNVEFRVEKISGQPDPTNAFILINFGDGSVTEVYVDNWDSPIPISHQYGPSSIGTVKFVVRIQNKVSNQTIKDEFLLQRQIEEPVLVTPTAVGVDKEFAVKASVSEGSHLTAEFILRDSNKVEVERKKVVYKDIADKELSTTFTVKKSEIYLMELLVSNDISSKNIPTPTQLFIQNPVDHIKFEEVKVIETKKDFSPKIIATLEPYPSAAKCLLSWGDGTPNLAQACPMESGKVTLNPHKYENPGQYKIVANVSNNIDDEIISLNFEAQEKIEGLSFMLKTSSLEQKSSEPLTKSLAVGTEVTFTASLTAGSNVTYTWILDGGFTEKTTQNVFVRKFSVPSDFELMLQASNGISSQEIKYRIKVVSDVGVQSVKFNGSVIVLIPEEIKIVLDKKPDSSVKQCFGFRFNTTVAGKDQEITFWRGNSQTTCRKDSNFVSDRFTEVPLAQEYTIPFTYDQKGLWQINLLALTEASSGSNFEFFVTVQNTPCNSPNVSIVPGIGGDSPAKMRVFFRSDPVSVFSTYFMYELDCKATDEILTFWEFYRLNKTNVNVGVKTPVSKYVGAIQNAGSVQFLPSTLHYGTYKVVYNVQMLKKGDPEVSKFRGHAGFYFEVKRTDLVAEIIYKNSRLVSFNESIEIDGITNTYDPDAKYKSDKSGMQFEWGCSKKGESFSWDTAKQIAHPDLNGRPAGCPNKTLPGCFGTGVGKLRADIGKFKLQTGSLCPLGEYYIYMKVIKGERTMTYRQLLRISAGKSPPVRIE